MKFFIKTFGCQMNENDSQLIRGKFLDKGWQEADSEDDADFLVVNTCAVRQKAQEKALWNVRSMSAKFTKKSKRKLAIVGCSAKDLGEKIKEYVPFVNYVIGPDNYRELDKILDTNAKRQDIVLVEDQSHELYDNFTDNYSIDGVKGYVSIIRGCNNFCTYCIVPYTRSRERSRSIKSIFNEIDILISKGAKEITLLGQNVNSYNYESYNFPKLLAEVAGIKELKRVSFLTSHPKDFSEELIDVMASNDKITRWMHLPFQAGSNKVLRDMNRNYTRESYLEKIKLLKAKIPDIGLSTDIIVAFPTETEEDFLETMDLVEKVRFDSAFTFIYSPRKGTAAAKRYKEEIESSVSKDRIKRLIDAQLKITAENSQKEIGKILPVLVESVDKKNIGFYVGRCNKNRVVKFKSDSFKNLIGELVDVKILSATSWSLTGELI